MKPLVPSTLFGMPADAAVRAGMPLASGGLSVAAFLYAAGGRYQASQMFLAAATLVGTFWAFANALQAEGPYLVEPRYAA